MNYYNTISSSYNKLHGEEQERKLSLVKKGLKALKITINPDWLVLDVGAGSGISSQLPGIVISLDPSEELLKLSPTTKIHGNGETLPFKDDSCDLVISLTALHNFDDWKKGIEEMKRVSKKYMVVSVLKKSKDYERIIEEVEKTGLLKKSVDDQHDSILFLKKG
jgi:ubiquinone/menaquinone biosynthesis C-methylase UbiE